jgi:hypothetical protein
VADKLVTRLAAAQAQAVGRGSQAMRKPTFRTCNAIGRLGCAKHVDTIDKEEGSPALRPLANDRGVDVSRKAIKPAQAAGNSIRVS